MKFLPIPKSKAALLGPHRVARVIDAVRAGQWPTDDEVIQSILSVPTHYIDLVITATSVKPYTTDETATIVGKQIHGEVETAGQWVYKKAAPDNKMWKAQCDGTAAEYGTLGVLLNGGSADQSCQYQSKGDITIGGTGVVGAEYYLSAVAGNMCLRTDLIATNRIIKLGYFKTAAIFHIEIDDLGVAVP